MVLVPLRRATPAGGLDSRANVVKGVDLLDVGRDLLLANSACSDDAILVVLVELVDNIDSRDDTAHVVGIDDLHLLLALFSLASGWLLLGMAILILLILCHTICLVEFACAMPASRANLWRNVESSLCRRDTLHIW